MEDHVNGEPDVRRVYLIVGTLVSVAAGLLLALVASVVVLIFAGNPTEGGYCSAYGIGQYEAPAPGVVVYLDEGWSGLPPKQRCRVYIATATYDNPPLSGEELLQRDPPPHHLLAEGTYPGTQEYVWIAGAFILPLGIWCLLLAISAFAGPRETPEG